MLATYRSRLEAKTMEGPMMSLAPSSSCVQMGDLRPAEVPPSWDGAHLLEAYYNGSWFMSHV